MRFGLKESEFLFLNQHLIRPLKESGLKVYIFGSRATGRNHPFSDVDILLEGACDSEIGLRIMNIKEFFEDSNFPYKIDLVKDEDLARSYRPGILSERIEV